MASELAHSTAALTLPPFVQLLLLSFLCKQPAERRFGSRHTHACAAATRGRKTLRVKTSNATAFRFSYEKHPVAVYITTERKLEPTRCLSILPPDNFARRVVNSGLLRSRFERLELLKSFGATGQMNKIKQGWFFGNLDGAWTYEPFGLVKWSLGSIGLDKW